MASYRNQPTIPPRPSYLDDEEEAVKKAIALSLVTAQLDEQRRKEKYSELLAEEHCNAAKVPSHIARPRPQPSGNLKCPAIPPRPMRTLGAALQSEVQPPSEPQGDNSVDKVSFAEMGGTAPRDPQQHTVKVSRIQTASSPTTTYVLRQQTNVTPQLQQNGIQPNSSATIKDNIDKPLIIFSPSLDPVNFDLGSLDPLKNGSEAQHSVTDSESGINKQNTISWVFNMPEQRSPSTKDLAILDGRVNKNITSHSTFGMTSQPESSSWTTSYQIQSVDNSSNTTNPAVVTTKAIISASNSLVTNITMTQNCIYGINQPSLTLNRSPSQENLYLPSGALQFQVGDTTTRVSTISEASSGYTIPDGAMIIHRPGPGDLMDFSDSEDTREYLSLESFDPLYSMEKSFDMELSTDSLGLFPNPLDRLQRKNTPNPFPDINPVTTQKLMCKSSAASPAEIKPATLEHHSVDSKSFEELQDPFDIPDLLKALERKRQNHVKDQAQRLESHKKSEHVVQTKKEQLPTLIMRKADSDRCAPLGRTCSSSYIQAGEESSYEILHFFSETADEEIQAFCAMVASLKMKHHNTDENTNPGVVISRRCSHPLYKEMTVKLLVKATFIEEPGYPFTCDVNATVSHVIGAVLLSNTDSLGSNSTDNYVLRVYGLSEYLLNDSCLADYDYVQQCLKLDVDIKFCLVEKSQMERSFLRTPEDDRNPLFVPKTKDTCENGQKITREKLNILMETYYKEVEKLRDSAIQNGLQKVQCKSVIQCVKAVCVLLYQMENIDIIKAVKRLQSVSLDKTLHISNSYDVESYGYVTKGGDAIIPVKDVDTNLRIRDLDDLHVALEELTTAVKAMIELYCRTFHTDFRFKSTTQLVREQNVSSQVRENLLVHVAAAHRIPLKVKNIYQDYKIICGLYYGGRKLVSEAVTTSQPKWAPMFGETLLWDEWVMFNSVMVCNLPRESRICFTLVGVKSIQSSNSDKVQKVNTPLGWVGLQLFNYEFKLTQGSQLLGLWPGDLANPTGTSLSNTEVAHSILLHVNLPQFECDYVFPSVQETLPSLKQDFKCLHPDDQESVNSILEKDSITSLTAEEADFLWHKRCFLYHRPEALPRIMQMIGSWYWGALSETYSMLHEWAPLSHELALELLLPRYPDTVIRKKATEWLSVASADQICDYLPQLVQALKFESYHTSALAVLILEKAICSVRVAHNLYWLLKEAADDARYRKRYQLMFGALLSVVGEKMRKELSKEEEVVRMFSDVAEKVKAAKEKEAVLTRELFNLWELLNIDSVRLPLNPAIEVTGVDVKSCKYFTSFTFPLKLVLTNKDPKADSHYAMFKVGDDLRQDMLTMQLIEMMDKLWLKDGLDLRMITFKCVHTGIKKGLVEIVTESQTLRKIQTKHGIAGSFKDRPIAEWLQLQNPTELEYQKAVDNFTASCAGYCIATYILGIGDRHNDNIMIKQSGHMFHIDFAKFLGDSQMFGSIKRDRVPFVLTQDMAYVINGGEKLNMKFQHFIDLCCQGFNIIRKYSNLFINLLSMMVLSGIPGVTDDAAKYVQKALLPDVSDAEATAMFTRMLYGSLKSTFTQFNFFLHNLAQMKFHGHSDGGLLSFIPKTYTIHQDGRIKNIKIHGIQKRYSPEKFYLYIIRVERESQTVPHLVFRKYSEFQELHHKLMLTFPLVRLPRLSNRVILGRTHVRSVAEERREELEHFLQELLSLAPEISECDLIYTFFHPMLKDEQDAGKTSAKLREVSSPKEQSHVIHGQVKLSISYSNQTLTIMVQHVTDLSPVSGSVPDPYVKLYLLPDPSKYTKRKTTIRRNTYHPTYNEMFQYHFALDELKMRTLQVTVWNYVSAKENDFLGAAFIPMSELDFSSEHTAWYPLQAMHFVTTSGK